MLRRFALQHRSASEDPVSNEPSDELPIVNVDSISTIGSQPIENVRRVPFYIRHRSDVNGRVSNSGGTLPATESLRDQLPDPLGLHLVYDHPEPSGDIVFVHGLGGTTKKTWSWNKEEDLFWPGWLADEDGLSSYRIFTFGYNSNIKGAGTNLNINDFAKDLLFQMLTFSVGLENDSVPIGQQPILFVAHSMGGLVVKKAYVLGKQDAQYTEVISKTRGIVFLATPHRGSQYAKMLNNILSAAPLGAPPKEYVADLHTQSRFLEDINEQFRIACGNLLLASFFETLKINVGVSKILVVEKESGVLGYPQEISNPLNANHHTVCKYRNREDGNYKSVRNILRLWASRLAQLPATSASIQTQRLTGKIDWIKTIEVISGIRETAEEELKTHRSKALDGTCGWIALKENFLEWVERLDTPQKPRVFWLVGLPAMGKTMLASYVADYLSVRGVGGDCQYHYFSSGHQNKRTIAYCLRSIISQLAHTNEDFRKKLITFHEENGVSLDSQEQNFGFIWEKIFEGIIFKMVAKPLFWILDAVDEANDPSTLVTSIMKIQSHTPIKVFFTSRPMKIPSASKTFGSPITTFLLTENDTVDDIRAYAHDVVDEFLPDDAQEARGTIIDEILAKAAGSFLWVRLALETLQDNWHTQDDISKALNEVPTGMEQLYKRMIERIETQSTRNKMMAKRILTWAACCWRPLSIAELRVALEPEFTGFVRLQDTIVQLCGNFISVDNGKLSLIHDTARHFLLNDRPDATAFIDPEYGHKHMATVCIDYLSDDGWKGVFKTLENSPTTENTICLKTDRVLLAEARHPFLDYAICFWAFHVSKSSLESDHLLLVLKGFLAKYCLSWIQAVALLTDFRFVTRSAQSLITYTRRMPARRRGHIPDSLSGPALSPNDDAKTIQSWAVDFVRLVRKFGSNLVQSPSAIHRYVAPLCPRTSMIGTFYGSRERSISVTGFPFENWDDCLASVSVGNEDTASTVIATETYFLTLISNGGTLVAWQANTCEEVLRMHHNEYVSSVAMDSSRTLLATAGSESYRIWDIASGKELHCLQKTARYLTEALAFGTTGSELVIGLDDCSVTCYDLESSQTKWRFAVTDHSEFPGCPFVMELSPDLTKLALSWRSKPPIVWDIPEAQSQRLLKCRNWIGTLDLCAPKAMQWQPDGNSVLVLSQNTEVVEWHFYDGEQHKFDHIKAHTMIISRDSKLLLTSDIMGNISIWTFPRLEPLYQLVNESGFVKGLAFSPDNRRFYGTIGSICNVWEPDALLSPYQHRRRDETSTSSDHTATEALLADEKPEVNAIAYSSDDEYFCAGNEAGLVSIHNAHDGRRIRKVSTHNSTSSVILLAWSHSNKYIVSADDASRVVAKRVEAKEANTWSVFPVFDFYAHAAVQQFLFNASEKLLLVSTSLADIVWDLKGQKEVCCQQWGRGQGRKWIQHPFQKEMLIWIDPFAVRTFSWKELAEINSSQPSTTGNIADPVGKAPEFIDSARSPIADSISTDLTAIGNANSTLSPRTGNTSTERPSTAEQHPITESTAVATTDTNGKAVLWIALMDNKQYIVYLCKTSHASTSLSHGLYLEFLSTSNFQVRQPHSLTSDFDGLAAQIMYLIGVYKDRVVFLDQDYWICTWRIYDGFSDVTRHFFIPKDWLDYSTMHMAALNAQGTFFCPKQGDVAIVRHGMRF